MAIRTAVHLTKDALQGDSNQAQGKGESSRVGNGTTGSLTY